MNVKKMKKISMVVPCFNSAKYLGECFASIRNQTLGLEGIQMIFVDDASTDNTLECLREFAGAYPQSVEVVSLAENRRQGGARNAGLARAVGEYVMFLDSDDWLDHSMCEKAYSKAAEYCVDILQFCFIHVFRQGSTKDSASRYGFLDGTLSEIRKGMLLGTLFTFGSQNKLYRTSFLKEQAAAFPEGVVYEEPYFVYPLLFEAERFYSMEEGLYYYRQAAAQRFNEAENYGSYDDFRDFSRRQPLTQQQKDAARQRYQSASPEQRQAVREKMQTNPQIQQRRDAARERIQSASPEQRQVFKEKVQQRPLNQQQRDNARQRVQSASPEQRQVFREKVQESRPQRLNDSNHTVRLNNEQRSAVRERLSERGARRQER